MNIRFDGLTGSELQTFLAHSGMGRAAALFRALKEIAAFGKCQITVQRFPSLENSVALSVVPANRSVYDNRHVVLAVRRLPNSAFHKRASVMIAATEYGVDGGKLPRRSQSRVLASLWSTYGRA